MKKLNFLLVNDDGYDAPGIRVLKGLLGKYGNIYMVAPLEAMSGKSASGTFNRPIKYNVIDEKTIAIDGTPVDCVDVGVSYFKDVKFDFVFSGINNGLNITYDTMYSGTVGACLEGLKLGIPSIAFSCEREDFDKVSANFDPVMDYIFSKKIYSKNYLLNINYPINDVRGIKIAKLFFRDDTHYFVAKDGVLTSTYEVNRENYQEGTDCYCSLNGFISIVPLSKTYFNLEVYNDLKGKCN